ncbi:unnamed protein product, partial [Mesorhabditis belari]|uniref:WDR36/Utp21 C-terminal domain-containing protein n=1 Tax=Mesorhabditis belari TaxID=2138241 RepID=A0AAF3EPF8_9BILA
MIALFDNYQPDLRQEERDTDEVLKTRKNFDLVQAYLASAMKIHRSVFWKKDDESPEMTEILEELSRTQDEAWAELDQLMVKNASVIQWAKNALL